MKRYSDNIISPSYFTSQNVSNLMDDTRAEELLRSAVYYIDARDASSSGQVVDNLGTAKELLPTTLGSSTSADSNDPQYLSWSGTNYYYNPGVNYTNYLAISSSNQLNITGSLDIRVFLSMDSWTSGSNSCLIGKEESTTDLQYSFRTTSGYLRFLYRVAGDNSWTGNVQSSTTLPFTNGQSGWVRVTFNATNRDIIFYTSTNGTLWTQLGTTLTGSGSPAVLDSTTAGLYCAGNAFTSGYASKFYRFQILNGINGSVAFDADMSKLKTGAETSFTAITGQTVYITRPGSGRKAAVVTQPCWLFGSDDYMEVNNRWIDGSTPNLYLPGISGNYASVPDSNALDVAGDIDIRVKVALDNWTPSGNSTLVGKWSGVNQSYIFRVGTGGDLVLIWSTNGTDTLAVGSLVPGFIDGSIQWIRVTLDVDNGSSGRDIKFYTSSDGINWTQLGTTITQSGTTSIFSGSSSLNIGSHASSTNESRGRFYRAQIFNGIDGTKVFDADFENKITSLEQTTFTEASSNAATVTINRSGSTYKSAGIIKSGYVYPGSINKFKPSSTSLLDFDKNESFSVIAISRAFSGGTGTGTVFAKADTYGGSIGYLQIYSKSDLMYQNSIMNWPAYFYYYSDVLSTTNGSLSTVALVREPSGTGNTGMGSTSTTLNYINGSAGMYQTSAGGSSGDVYNTISNPYTFRLGMATQVANAFDGEIQAVAVFRRALTQQETILIYNYFNRRAL